MKKLTLLIVIAFISTLTVLAQIQPKLQEGDKCFNEGKYKCAINKYGKIYRSEKGRTRHIAEIKFKKAKECDKFLQAGDKAFKTHNYSTAKMQYQRILKKNPKDGFAKSQIKKCKIILNTKAGDECFTKGDYECAISEYDDVIKINGVVNMADIAVKQTKSKKCLALLQAGNEAFKKQYYSKAKTEYQRILARNKSDEFVKLRIKECDVMQGLRKASISDLTDIWNNKYGNYPNRRQNLINAGINPYDAQQRINAGEGKPKEKEIIDLRVSKQSLVFNYDDKSFQQIKVFLSKGLYKIPSLYVSSWCKVKVYSDYFTVKVKKNNSRESRRCVLYVTSGDARVKVDILQMPRSKSYSTRSSNNCFNCPQTNDNWGITVGYYQQEVDDFPMEAIQLGLKWEPLFKGGFGINTGVNFLGYSSKLFENDMNAYVVNIPLHLEYRLNFSKWFNVFAYGGVGGNLMLNSDFENSKLSHTIEYGVGFRINHLQFNVGRSLGRYVDSDSEYMRGYRDYTQDYIDSYRKVSFSVSYMF